MNMLLTGLGAPGSWTPASLSIHAATIEALPANIFTTGARLLTASDKACWVAADHANLNITTGDVLLSVMVRRVSTGEEVILSKRVDDNNVWYLKFDSANKLEFKAVIGGVTKSLINGTTAVTTLNQWYHVAVVVDRDTEVNNEIYLDSAVDKTGSATISEDTVTNAGSLFVGQWGDGTLYLDAHVSRILFAKPTDASAVAADFVSTTYGGGGGVLYGALTAAQKTAWNTAGGFAYDCTESGDPTTGKNLIDSVGSNDGVFTAAELVTNGNMSAGTPPAITGWTRGAGWTGDGATANHDGTGITTLTQSLGLVSGNYYDITAAITNYAGTSTAGLLSTPYSSVTGTATRSNNGAINCRIVSNGTTFGFFGRNTNTHSLDNASCKAATAAAVDGPRVSLALDESVNANHGVLTGFSNVIDAWSVDVPTAANVADGWSIEFNATDYINLGDLTYLNSVAAFTIAFWFKQDVIDAGTIWFDKTLDATNKVRIMDTGGNLQFIVSNAGAMYGYFDYSTAVTAVTWHHGMFVFNGAGTGDAGRMQIYIDGVLQSLTFSGTIPATTVDLATYNATISETSFAFDGKMDDFRIYSTALTVANALSLTAGTDVGTPVGHWTFDDGPQGAVNDGDPVTGIITNSRGDLFKQTTLTKRPTFNAASANFNSKPTLSFDGITQMLTCVTSMAVRTEAAGRIVVVGKCTAPGEDDVFIAVSNVAETDEYAAVGTNGTLWTLFHISGATLNEAVTDLAHGTTALIHAAGSTGAAYKYNASGTEKTITATDTDDGDWFESFASDLISLGGLKLSTGETRHMAYETPEINFLNADPTAAQMAAIVNYHKTKYALA